MVLATLFDNCREALASRSRREGRRTVRQALPHGLGGKPQKLLESGLRFDLANDASVDLKFANPFRVYLFRLPRALPWAGASERFQRYHLASLADGIQPVLSS